MKILDHTRPLTEFLLEESRLEKLSWVAQVMTSQITLVEHDNHNASHTRVLGLFTWWKERPCTPLFEVWDGHEIRIPAYNWELVVTLVRPFVMEFESETGYEVSIIKVKEFTSFDDY